jgi:hypothetical protein
VSPKYCWEGIFGALPPAQRGRALRKVARAHPHSQLSVARDHLRAPAVTHKLGQSTTMARMLIAATAAAHVGPAYRRSGNLGLSAGMTPSTSRETTNTRA